MKEHSSPLGTLVLPLIRESLSPAVSYCGCHVRHIINRSEKFIVQLDIDALNLWSSSLRNTLSVSTNDGSPCLRDIFPDAVSLLGTNLDILGSVVGIMESYFLLDAEYILKVKHVPIKSMVL